jgi:hypothetical protein
MRDRKDERGSGQIRVEEIGKVEEMGKVEEIGKARAIETRDAEHTSLQQNPQPSTLNPQPSTLNPQPWD